MLAAGLFASACTMPYQQLTLPGPIPPDGTTGTLASASRKPGVPLANAGSGELSGARIYKGTDDLSGAPSTRVATEAAPNGNGVTINLVEAPIRDAAKSVLGDILGVNYVVADSLKGNITLQTTKPVSKDALLETFEAVLRAEGAAIVTDGQLYRVLPVEQALAQGAPLRGRAMAKRLPGVSTQIIPLQHVAAGEMERIVKSMAPQAQVVRADAARNLLVVAGTRADLAAVLEAVAVFDVDTMKGMSFGIFPVESADPDAIAQELDAFFGNDRDGPGKGMIRFIPNKRMRAVLAMSARGDYIEKAEKWLQRLDLASRATDKQVHVYHVQNRPAVELAQLLQKVYQGQEAGRGATAQSSSTAPRDVTVTLSAPAQPPVPTSSGSVLAGPSPTGTAFGPAAPASPLAGANSGASASLADPAQPSASPTQPPLMTGSLPDDRTSGISIVADEPNNALVITATASEYKRVRRILERIDAAVAQVMLEATIAEVTLNDQLRFGLRWFFEKGASEFRLTNSALGAIAPVFPGFSYFVNTPNVQVAINALSSITDVNVVSSPTLMTLDNKKAVLQVGDEVPVITVQQQATITPGAPIVNAVSFRNTGVILSITPRVSDQGRVLLDIEQEVSDAVQTTTSGIDAPTFQQRRIKTTVAVGDGEAIVLAGMMQDRATRTNEGVPILGQVPVVGNLFKNKNDQIRRTELLIAITPRVVKDPHAIRGIAAEFRDKINLSTRPQRRAPPDKREQVDRLLR